MHSADDLVVCLSYFYGHVGRHIDRIDHVIGEYGVCKKFGGMLLEYCPFKQLRTWYMV